MISPMNQRLLAEIGRTQRLEILNSLKRTKGMSVNELVEKMGMSYMGIKQHCLTLQRDGYLDAVMIFFRSTAISLLSNCSNRFATSTERTRRKSFFTMCLKSGRRS